MFVVGESERSMVNRQIANLNGVRASEVDSDADYILFSEQAGLLSEHCTEAEARMAYFKEAARFHLGDQLPNILQRGTEGWVPVG